MRPKYYKNSLPIHLQKQLLDDIEAAGGIKNCVGRDKYLSNLLNNLAKDNPLKEELYGKLKDPVRQQIQKKVWSWQKIFTSGGQTAYDKFLEEDFPGITPFRFRTQQDQQQQQQPQQQPEKPTQPQPEQPKKTQQKDTTADLLNQFSKLNLGTMNPPPQQKADPPADPDAKLITHFVTPNTTPIPFEYDKRKTLVIFANTEWPEHNTPFQIYDINHFMDVDKENSYFGFSIVEEIDERAVSSVNSQSNFRGRILAPNILKFTNKAMHPCFEQGSNDLDHLEVKPTARNLLRAINNTHERRRKMDEKERMERDWRDILIIFPSFVKLSAKNLWEIGADEKELRPMSIKIPYTLVQPGKPPVPTKKTFFHWDVARIDYLPTKDTRVQEEMKNWDAQALESPPAAPSGAYSAFPFGSPGTSPGAAYGHRPGAGHYPGAGYPPHGSAYSQPAGFGSPPAAGFGPSYPPGYPPGYYGGYNPPGPAPAPAGPPPAGPPTGGSYPYGSTAGTTAGTTGTTWGEGPTPRASGGTGAAVEPMGGGATTGTGNPHFVPEDGSTMSYDCSLGGGSSYG